MERLGSASQFSVMGLRFYQDKRKWGVPSLSLPTGQSTILLSAV